MVTNSPAGLASHCGLIQAGRLGKIEGGGYGCHGNDAVKMGPKAVAKVELCHKQYTAYTGLYIVIAHSRVLKISDFQVVHVWNLLERLSFFKKVL
jgi:hypothetical protein